MRELQISAGPSPATSLNVQIPFALAGQGDVHIALTADGQDANELLIQVK